MKGLAYYVGIGIGINQGDEEDYNGEGNIFRRLTDQITLRTAVVTIWRHHGRGERDMAVEGGPGNSMGTFYQCNIRGQWKEGQERI